jgi:hypothetical protein
MRLLPFILQNSDYHVPQKFFQFFYDSNHYNTLDEIENQNQENSDLYILFRGKDVGK